MYCSYPGPSSQDLNILSNDLFGSGHMETRAAETHKGWKESDYNLAISANLRSLTGASCLFKVKGLNSLY